MLNARLYSKSSSSRGCYGAATNSPGASWWRMIAMQLHRTLIYSKNSRPANLFAATVTTLPRGWPRPLRPTQPRPRPSPLTAGILMMPVVPPADPPPPLPSYSPLPATLAPLSHLLYSFRLPNSVTSLPFLPPPHPCLCFLPPTRHLPPFILPRSSPAFTSGTREVPPMQQHYSYHFLFYFFKSSFH